MALEEAFVEHLVAASAITTLVATRVHPDKAPQAQDLPYVTYHVLSTTHDEHLSGASGIARARVQIDVWASTSSSRRAVAEALRERLHGFRGVMGTANAVRVEHLGFSGPENSFESPIDGTDVGSYRGRCDALIVHRETIPTF